MGTETSPSGTLCRGFTLIEILVVMAVVAILALLAIPSYLDTIIRKDILEALPLAEVATRPVSAAWMLDQDFPIDNTVANLPPPEKIVNHLINSVAIEGGAVHITFGNRANGLIRGKVLTLRPAVVWDAPMVPVSWVCGYSPVPGQMTAEGTNRTNIPAHYLPLKCRAS